MSRDDYLIPGLGEAVLRNTQGFDKNDDLSRFEREQSRANLALVHEDPIGPTFDRAHLATLHARAFHNVYDWAGRMRDESFTLPDGTSIGRMEALHKGDKAFAPASDIEARLDALSETIQAADGFKNLPPAQFSQKATKILAELNDIHPFREGNGRTQRAFLSELGRQAGHEIDWKGIDRDRNLDASKATDAGDLEPLGEMLRDAIQPERQTLLRDTNTALGSRADLEWLRIMDDWGDLRQRTVLPGESVSGRLYAVTDNAALILDENNALHVARVDDISAGSLEQLGRGLAPPVSVTGGESQQDRLWQLDQSAMISNGPTPLPETREEWAQQSAALIDQVPDGPRKEEMIRLLGEIEQDYEAEPSRDDGFDREY